MEKVPAGLREAEHRPSQGEADCGWEKPRGWRAHGAPPEPCRANKCRFVTQEMFSAWPTGPTDLRDWTH